MQRDALRAALASLLCRNKKPIYQPVQPSTRLTRRKELRNPRTARPLAENCPFGRCIFSPIPLLTLLIDRPISLRFLAGMKRVPSGVPRHEGAAIELSPH